MKSAFSPKWKSSTQPRKQRKYLYNLPQHLADKTLAIHLSKELRAKHGQRAIRARVGDKVRVLRGTFKSKEGKIERIDVKNSKVIVAGVERVKREGGNAPYPLTPSNLVLTELATDKRRFKRAEEKRAGQAGDKGSRSSKATPAKPSTQPPKADEKKSSHKPETKKEVKP